MVHADDSQVSKQGVARFYIDDDDTGQHLPVPTDPPYPANVLAQDEHDALTTTAEGAPGGVNCFRWAMNIPGNPVDFDTAVEAAKNVGILWPDATLDDALVDAQMMKRVLEALLYKQGSVIRGYRASGLVPDGWHKIRAYYHPNSFSIRAPVDYHFSTETFDLTNHEQVWTEKGGWGNAVRRGDDSFGIFHNSTFVGEYYVAGAERTLQL